MSAGAGGTAQWARGPAGLQGGRWPQRPGPGRSGFPSALPSTPWPRDAEGPRAGSAPWTGRLRPARVGPAGRLRRASVAGWPGQPLPSHLCSSLLCQVFRFSGRTGHTRMRQEQPPPPKVARPPPSGTWGVLCFSGRRRDPCGRDPCPVLVVTASPSRLLEVSRAALSRGSLRTPLPAPWEPGQEVPGRVFSW